MMEKLTKREKTKIKRLTARLKTAYVKLRKKPFTAEEQAKLNQYTAKMWQIHATLLKADSMSKKELHRFLRNSCSVPYNFFAAFRVSLLGREGWREGVPAETRRLHTRLGELRNRVCNDLFKREHGMTYVEWMLRYELARV